jgi:Helix-turn-helix domain
MSDLKPGSQADRIIRYLARGKTLTAFSALRLFGALRLGGRIHELRARQWDIKSKPLKLRDGRIIAVYSL